MGLTRGMRRPIEVLYKRLNGPVKSFHADSNFIAYRGISFIASSEDYVARFSNYFFPTNVYGTFFSRSYSHVVPASEQMNLIKQLRERTCAPIKEVKTSLVSCDWDIEAAQKDLRKRGVFLASKKSTRIAAEGLLALAKNEKKAVVVELNCETDFVARNEIFQHLASSLAKSALLLEDSRLSSAVPFEPKYLEDVKMVMNHPKLSGERTAKNAITEVVAMMGENVKLGSCFTMSMESHGVLSTYLHTSPQPGLGRIAGLVFLKVDDDNAPLEAVHRVGSELAMHVVASKPLFLTKEDVSSDALDSEREVLRSQAESTGKSQMAVDKMVEGRLKKYYEEVVLLEQKYVLNDSLNVKMVLDNLSKEVGSPVKIGNFLRVEVGALKRLHVVEGSEPLEQAA